MPFRTKQLLRKFVIAVIFITPLLLMANGITPTRIGLSAANISH